MFKIVLELVGLLDSTSGETSTSSSSYLTQELQHFPFYPSEILPLFLYLGDRRHAYNAAMNYDLKIHAHLNMAGELHSAFPGAVAELHIEVDDCTGSSNLLARFEEMCTFLGQL